CRLHHPASHVFRDARQFLLRRLLQGSRDRARLEPRHQGIRAAQGSADRHGLCRGRGSRKAVEEDRGSEIPGGPPGSADADGDRFVEIWNLVFMQYEQVTPGERRNLPRPSIDTGMGLERIAAVLQGKHDNYDTDTLRALVLASAEASKVAPDGPHAVSHRVIADHLRASSFLIADGVLPSKEGRGYVLRRIMRRAMRHAHIIGCVEPLMWRLVPALLRQMGAAFPELHRAEALITETLRLEETNFKQTLERGLRLLDEEDGKLKA